MKIKEKDKINNELLPLLRKCWDPFTELEDVKGSDSKDFQEAYNKFVECEVILTEIILKHKKRAKR